MGSEMLPYSIILKLEGGDFLFGIEKKSFGNSRRKDEGYTLCLQADLWEIEGSHESFAEQAISSGAAFSFYSKMTALREDVEDVEALANNDQRVPKS